MDEEARRYYEDYVVSSHGICDKSVVLLLSYKENDPEKEVTSLQTGTIFASGEKSCCIMTTSAFTLNSKTHVCEAHFFDKTKTKVEKYIVQKEFGITIIYAGDVNMAKVERVTFSDENVGSHERVFTCGYNSNQKGRSFFSGSIVSGVGMKHKDLKHKNMKHNLTLFVHGCATGTDGHLGSAVFDETHRLVGMNVKYTKSSGPNYGSLAEGDEIESDIGGIVYALDLTSIQLGLASAAQKMSTAARDKKLVGMVNMKEKTISEIVQFVRENILEMEAAEASKAGGSSTKGRAGGG